MIKVQILCENSSQQALLRSEWQTKKLGVGVGVQGHRSCLTGQCTSQDNHLPFTPPGQKRQNPRSPAPRPSFPAYWMTKLGDIPALQEPPLTRLRRQLKPAVRTEMQRCRREGGQTARHGIWYRWESRPGPSWRHLYDAVKLVSSLPELPPGRVGAEVPPLRRSSVRPGALRAEMHLKSGLGSTRGDTTSQRNSCLPPLRTRAHTHAFHPCVRADLPLSAPSLRRTWSSAHRAPAPGGEGGALASDRRRHPGPPATCHSD